MHSIADIVIIIMLNTVDWYNIIYNFMALFFYLAANSWVVM